MFERSLSPEEAARRFNNLKQAIENGEPIIIPNADELNDVMSQDKKDDRPADAEKASSELANKLPEFTEEDAEKMNKRFPDTF